MHAVIINSTGVQVGPTTEESYSRQFELVRGWKNDENLSPGVRRFARNLEGDLYDTVDEDIDSI